MNIVMNYVCHPFPEQTILFYSFAGMLMGLVVRYLPFSWGEHVDSKDTVCCWVGLNSTQLLMVNFTSHCHGFGHAGKVNYSCPPVSATHLVNVARLFDLVFKFLWRWVWVLLS